MLNLNNLVQFHVKAIQICEVMLKGKDTPLIGSKYTSPNSSNDNHGSMNILIF